MWYTSPPALADMSCRSRVICVCVLTGSTGCGTPVPQPLSVMNSVKAKSDRRLMVGEGVSGVKLGGFGAIVFKSHVSCNDGVDWYELLFWREGVFTIWDSGL